MIVAALSAPLASSSSTPRASSRRRRTSASCSPSSTRPPTRPRLHELYTDRSRELTAGPRRRWTPLLGRRLRRHNTGFASGCSRTGPSASAAQARDAAGRAGPDQRGRRRAGLRLRAADAAGHRRRPAGPVRHPLDRRRRPGLRGRRGDQETAQASGRFIVVQNSLAFSQPQARVTIDRDRAAALGVTVSEIGTTLGPWSAAARSPSSTANPNSYDVITQVPRRVPLQPRSLGAFFVRSASGTMVPLSAVITIETGRAGRDRAVQPAELRHDLGAAAARRRDRRRARRQSAGSRAR